MGERTFIIFSLSFVVIVVVAAVAVVVCLFVLFFCFCFILLFSFALPLFSGGSILLRMMISGDRRRKDGRGEHLSVGSVDYGR